MNLLATVHCRLGQGAVERASDKRQTAGLAGRGTGRRNGGQEAASAQVTHTLATVLASLNTQIKALEAQIAAHADNHIFTSLPALFTSSGSNTDHQSHRLDRFRVPKVKDRAADSFLVADVSRHEPGSAETTTRTIAKLDQPARRRAVL